MTLHTDRELNHQLEVLRGRLLRMAGLVETMIEDSVRSLMEVDVDLARQTIARDHQVNRIEVETDEQCLLIIARWQPVASDLRFVTIALKMVTDLERIGDLAVNICERAIDLASRPAIWPWDELREMTRITRDMVQGSVDAFVKGDAVAAQAVIDQDDEVDDLYVQAFQHVLSTMQEHHEDLPGGIHALSVIKWLERIADHATNLSELVVFMVKGKDIRHMGSQVALGSDR